PRAPVHAPRRGPEPAIAGGPDGAAVRRGADSGGPARLARLSDRPLRDRGSGRGQRRDAESGGPALPHPADGSADPRTLRTRRDGGVMVRTIAIAAAAASLSAPSAAEACGTRPARASAAQVRQMSDVIVRGNLTYRWIP